VNDRDQGPEDLTERLRALRVDRPAGDFSARLHLRLQEAGSPERPGLLVRLAALARGRRGWLWPVSGVLAGAASFALVAALSGSPGRPAPAAPPAEVASTTVTRGEVLPTFVVPPAKVAVIKLAFAADVDVEDVTFEVTLPEGLAFWSRGQALPERSFRWPGRLSAGENLFPVAVRGERPGRYRVRARAEVAGQSEAVEHEIWLEVRGPVEGKAG
jgi:hypothetical protein